MARYALISDIHGNFKAFEAFLEYIKEHPVDGVISLGDYVTDGPYPERTIALLHEMRKGYDCYMIRGNREDYILNNAGNREGWKPSSANGMLYYTYQRLTEADKAFLASLPTEREVGIAGCPPLYICHGMPGSVRGNVYLEKDLLEKSLAVFSYRYLLGGHTHHQAIGHVGDKRYVNPGALGLAIDGVGRRAQFAMLEGNTEGWEAECLSIPYDVDGYLNAFTESGADTLGMTLNKATKKSIVTGENYFFRMISAMEAEAAAAGAGSIADMPEEVWERVGRCFGL